ncbi:hypothetical protein SEEC0006_12008 [Salmonella enterica subsp. enterica serovar Choleraesuis str. 0006]|nr:hypothetical protein SEEC0006_12008 [Salmonella enterica subsp. enterica serovar Choleraesuis str. 0006]
MLIAKSIAFVTFHNIHSRKFRKAPAENPLADESVIAKVDNSTDGLP